MNSFRFWLSVMASVIAYYVCKWLDGLIAFLTGN